MIKVVLETILENLKRLDFFGFIFSQKILFLNFLLRRGLQTTQNVLHFLIWWVETETNTLTSINLWNKIWGNFEREPQDLKMHACSETSIQFWAWTTRFENVRMLSDEYLWCNYGKLWELLHRAIFSIEKLANQRQTAAKRLTPW